MPPPKKRKPNQGSCGPKRERGAPIRRRARTPDENAEAARPATGSSTGGGPNPLLPVHTLNSLTQDLTTPGGARPPLPSSAPPARAGRPSTSSIASRARRRPSSEYAPFSPEPSLPEKKQSPHDLLWSLIRPDDRPEGGEYEEQEGRARAEDVLIAMGKVIPQLQTRQRKTEPFSDLFTRLRVMDAYINLLYACPSISPREALEVANSVQWRGGEAASKSSHDYYARHINEWMDYELCERPQRFCRWAGRAQTQTVAH
ncbi:hypothetical protein IAT38_000074 [Cryptococcus sp. DSM 104549]